MKVQAVKDATGQIISTFEISDDGMKMEPVLKQGEKLELMDVASNYKDSPEMLYRH